MHYIIENIHSPQNSSFCVDADLKAIFDSNAILKGDDLLCTNGLISHSKKET